MLYDNREVLPGQPDGGMFGNIVEVCFVMLWGLGRLFRLFRIVYRKPLDPTEVKFVSLSATRSFI